MFKQIINAVQSTYLSVHENNFDKVDPHIVRYFRTEYGDKWEEALELHLQTKNNKNVKKAA